MPLCPQITNTPITVAVSADYTVTSVTPITAATTADTGSLQTQITTAQATADGKNKVTYSTSSPSGSGTNVGDIWWQYSAGIVIGQWSWTGASWASSPISSAVIANLDAAKITSGIISSIEYNNGSGTFRVTAAGALTATSATISGTVNASAGTFSGTITAGGIIQSSSGSNAVSLVGSTNSLTFKNGGSNVGHIVPLSSNGVLMHYGASADSSGGTFPQMYVGSANASMSASATHSIGVSTSIGINLTASSGNINLNSQTNYTGVATGSGTSMVLVTTGSRIAIVTSSERFKEEVKYVDSQGWLNKILALKPITYKTSEDFTTAGEENETQYGFLAEDIYDLGGGLEKAVVLDPLGDPFSLSYDRFTVFLTLAIKELKADIDKLDIVNLLSLVQDLIKRVEELEAK